MAPTIKAGEQVTIDYLAYATTTPHRWDVVALRAPNGFTMLKRVIALPAETISLTSTGIVVDGALVSMPPALSNIVYCPPERLPLGNNIVAGSPYAVPPNQYFVVGDDWTKLVG